MKPGPETVRAYLLGKLSADERAALDKKFALAGEGRMALDIGESALVDDYAMGLLSEADRRSFEAEFLVNDHRRESLLLARGIVKLESVRRRRKWWIAAAVATTGILLLALLFQKDPAGGTFVLALAPNVTRGGDLPEVRMERESTTLVLELRTPEPPPACVATVGRAGAEEVFLRIRLPRTGERSVRIAIEGSLLRPGDYHVKLAAGEAYQRDFAFRVLE